MDFKPPLVEPAQAPITPTIVIIIQTQGCHIIKSLVVKPVVEEIETTLNRAFLTAPLKFSSCAMMSVPAMNMVDSLSNATMYERSLRYAR